MNNPIPPLIAADYHEFDKVESASAVQFYWLVAMIFSTLYLQRTVVLRVFVSARGSSQTSKQKQPPNSLG